MAETALPGRLDPHTQRDRPEHQDSRAFPFELAVGLNAYIDLTAIATFATQAEANAAVDVEVARYGVMTRKERRDKRNYRQVRLTLAPDDHGVTAHVEIVSRAASAEIHTIRR